MTKMIIAILEKMFGEIIKVQKAEDRKYFVAFKNGYEKDNMIVVVFENEAEDVIKSVFMPHPMSDDPVEDITDEILAQLG